MVTVPPVSDVESTVKSRARVSPLANGSSGKEVKSKPSKCEYAVLLALEVNNFVQLVHLVLNSTDCMCKRNCHEVKFNTFAEECYIILHLIEH